MTSPQQNCNSLLKLAQAQGYTAHITEDVVYVKKPNMPPSIIINKIYNPAENAEQLVRLEIWLLDGGWIIDKVDELYYISHHELGCIYNKDFAQAIIQAALKVIGE